LHILRRKYINYPPLACDGDEKFAIKRLMVGLVACDASLLPNPYSTTNGLQELPSLNSYHGYIGLFCQVLELS